MAWVYLVIAGIMEWGWPMGLKFAWTDQGIRLGPASLAVGSILLSGFFLLLAQREIPVVILSTSEARGDLGTPGEQADACAVKPIDGEGFRELVKNLVSSWAGPRELERLNRGEP